MRADNAYDQSLIDKLLAVIERLGSTEAFGVPFCNDDKTTAGKELTLRVEYARAQYDLYKTEKEGQPNDK